MVVWFSTAPVLLCLTYVLHLRAFQNDQACADCLLIAKALEGKLSEIEPATGLGWLPGQRRKLTHPRSEPQLFAAIDGMSRACIRIWTSPAAA